MENLLQEWISQLYFHILHLKKEKYSSCFSSWSDTDYHDQILHAAIHSAKVARSFKFSSFRVLYVYVCAYVGVCMILITFIHPPQRIGNISKLIFLNEGIYTFNITMPWASTVIRNMDKSYKGNIYLIKYIYLICLI